MQKPIVIAREELKETIMSIINGSELPMFIIADILRPILVEAEEKTHLQYQMEMEKYKKEQEEKEEAD